jgi:hypothetical protein
MGNDRKQAIALKAADARALIKSKLPYLLPLMSKAQIDQVQRVLDAAVVNPEAKKQYQELMRKAIIAQSGSIVMRDPKLERRADKVFSSQIPVGESDKHIRLDFERLLDAAALNPVTDNTDEAAYLKKVRHTLADRGVWLRITQPFVRDPNEPSSHMIDPRKWDAWLSVGYDGDHIPTDTGLITRDSLLKTTLFGAGYYEQVHLGGVQTALKKEINRLLHQISDGQDEHYRLIRRKDDAFPGVAELSDWAGGASLPSRSIWDQPHKLVLKAMDLNTGGNIRGAQAFLVTAAILTRNSALLLNEYAEKSSSGAGKIVKVLEVAKTAGEIAEIGLAVTGVTAVVRGGVRVVSTTAARSEVDELAEKVVTEYIKKNPDIAADLNKVRWVPGPKGSVGGRGIKPGQSSGNGTGWHSW